VKTVGVISFQGDFERHLERSRVLGVHALPVRDAQALSEVDAIIIPGGESTTIGMLLDRFDMLEPIRRRIADGLPVLGTCAGAILLADEILGSDQPRIGGLHIAVQRNAYGRQIESFEADVTVADSRWTRWADGSVLGVFIRAPVITSVADDVDVMLQFEGKPVMVQQDNILAATFHPELTGDTRVHEYFFSIVDGS
jgi:5'-phosphate synthase pdxT subunit